MLSTVSLHRKWKGPGSLSPEREFLGLLHELINYLKLTGS